MSNKTKRLFDHYFKVIKEQGEREDEAPQDEFDSTGGEDVLDNPEPVEDETMPLTSEGEDRYISDMVDAALYEPSPEEARTLVNLQNVMSMKRYENAREEVLPTVLSFIRPESDNNDLKQSLNNI